MRTRTVATDEARLHVVEAGDTRNPAILFLHGFPDCHKVWQHQLDALSKDFHVIAFDLRGCGKSTAPDAGAAFRIERIMPDIEAVIDATRGRKGRVHLVGHDWGSVLGWSFVSDPLYAPRVLSWTSMSGPHVGLIWQWLGRRIRSGSLSQWRSAFEQFAHSWYIFAFNIPGAARALFRFAGVEVWKRAMQQGGVPANDPYLDVGQDDVERMTLYPISLYQQNAFRPPAPLEPGSVTMPTQLIVPLQDAFVRPQLFSELDEICPRLERAEVDANHWAQRSNPKEITALIRAFVKRCGDGNEGVQRKAGAGNRSRQRHRA
ncbi:MAG: alpha/beta fold hydrolase [Pseudomonadota bacterium]